MDPLPPGRPGTVLRILATNDMGAAYVAVPTSWGRSGTCAGVAELLERESAQQPTVWPAGTGAPDALLRALR